MKRVTLAAAVLAVFGVLAAAPDSLADGMNGKKLYFGAAAGVSMRGEEDITTSILGVTTESAVKYDPAAAFAGYVGYDFGKIRTDLEVRYASNSVDSISGATASSGDVSNLAVMANAYYDISLENAKVTPYIGGGLGLVHINADTKATTLAGETTVDDSDTVFGGQAIAGASYPLNDRVSLTADYRLMYADGASLKGELAGATATVESDATFTHNFMLGLRVGF